MVFHGPSFLMVTSQVVPSPFFTKKDGVLVPQKPSNQKTKRYGVTQIVTMAIA